MIKINTVYDNNPYNSNCITDWGYSCVIEHLSCKIMFDTGANPEILKHNLEVLQINPESITHCIISHKHWDHKGGVSWLMQQNSKMIVYMPKTFIDTLFSSASKRIISIQNNIEINEKLHLILSKSLFINELALAISTSNGIIIITGCSHTGIDKIITKTQKSFNTKIYGVIGGFHLLRSSNRKIKEISNFLKNIEGVDFVAPCHCSGELAMKKLKTDFCDIYRKNGVGAQYVFDL